MELTNLYSELGKALSVHERACFFSTSPAEDPIYAKRLIYFRSDITDGQNLSADALVEACDFITDTYSLSSSLLIIRLTEVENIYFRLRAKGADLADRHRNAILQSKEIILGRFRDLVDLINLRIKIPVVNNKDKVVECSRHWEGLSKMCYLLMDEITFLSQRVEGINNVLSTKKSITYAIWGIGFGVAFSLISVVISLTGKKAALGSDFFVEVGTMKYELAILEESHDKRNHATNGEEGASAMKPGDKPPSSR